MKLKLGGGEGGIEEKVFGREGTEDGGIGSGLVIVLMSRLDGKENRCCMRLHVDKLDPFLFFTADSTVTHQGASQCPATARRQ